MYTQFAHFNEPYTWLFFLTTFVTWAVALVLLPHRHQPGGGYLSLMLAAMGVWALSDGFSYMSVTLAGKYFWFKPAWFGVAFVPPLLLAATLQMTGHGRVTHARWFPLLWVIPTTMLLLVFTNDWHNLIWNRPTWVSEADNVITYEGGRLYWVQIAFSNVAVMTAVWLYLRVLRQREGPFRGQALGSLPALLLPWVANMLYFSGLGPPVDLTPIAFGLTGALIAFTFMRYRLLNLTPVARELVIDSMPDGIITLDAANQVVDYNPAARQLLQLETTRVVGEKIETLLAHWPELLARLQQSEPEEQRFSVEAEQPSRSLRVRLTPLAGYRGRPQGRLLFLHDITDLKQTERQLQRKTDEMALMTEQVSRLFEEERLHRKMAESLGQTALALNSSLDLQEVIGKILTLLRQVVPFDSAGLFLHNDDHLVLTTGIGLDPLLFGYRLPLDSPNQTVQVFNRHEPVALGDVRQDPHWEALPPVGHLIRSWMAAPLLLGGQAIGVVTLDEFAVNAYGNAEVAVLQTFAGHAAVAVQNARLHQQAQQAAAQDERSRLAQELHDAVNQTLFSAGLIAEAIPNLWQKDPEQARQGLEELRWLTQSALAEMRTLLLELRPSAITDKNLGELLDYLAGTITARARLKIDLSIEHDDRLPPPVQLAFYRISQEAFNNIVKHAQATQVKLDVDCYPDEAALAIGDNGRGFDPAHQPPGHIGLEIMRERAAAVGAALEIISAPGRGTTIKLLWQQESEADDD